MSLGELTELVQDRAQLLGAADLRSEKACFISRIVVYVFSDSLLYVSLKGHKLVC